MKQLWKAAMMLLATLSLSAVTVQAAVNTVTPGKLVVEPPTLLCAGFEWNIQGDDNRNASVEVSYRKKGATAWIQGLPLLRLNGERVVYKAVLIDYTAPNMFAGSIFDLEPGATYECRFTLKDPDGVKGQGVKTTTVTTRSEPKAYSGGRTLHVYPPGFKGQKQEPSFESIAHAYYGPGKGLWHTAKIEPGDIILVHSGEYKSDRIRYYEPLGLHFHGAYQLSKSGTQEKPIVIRGAGDGEAVLDGGGVYRLFDAMFADYIHIENLTIKNCEVGIMAGLRYTAGCQGLVVRNCRFENVGCAVNAQYGGSRNFYIADNVILGREDQDRLHGWTGNWAKYGPLSDLKSFIAIDINGQGHVICHNYIAYFHDAIDVTEQGAPEKEEWKAASMDFHNNDMHMCADDFIEADSSVHNLRVFRNRGFNAGQHAYSAQPIFGGPAYFIRNIAYHIPSGGALKFNIYPAGVLAYHNTFCSEWTTSPPFSNVHFRNNLFLGEDYPKRPILRVSTYTGYTTFDYNGYRPNQDAENQFVWKAPSDKTALDYELKTNTIGGSYKTLQEFFQAAGQEQHGVLVDYDIFRNVRKADPEKPGEVFFAKDFDFRLVPGSKAVDAGCALSNINDGFSGKAPDLGAYEAGAPEVVYGPRTGLKP
ncbi:MAG: right-handed parallel beta-helix repeat-containing protein [Candidatus Latescibacterota bacterium]